MTKDFNELLEIARSNISRNPSLFGRSTNDIANQYLNGLKDELNEVMVEIKESNQIYLQDELSDIAWDYACVLASLEAGGYIESATAVIEHGLNKYAKRSPAFLEASDAMWEAIKVEQKADLKKQHQAKYGN